MPNTPMQYSGRVFSHRFGPFRGIRDGKGELATTEHESRSMSNYNANNGTLAVRHGFVDTFETATSLNSVGVSHESWIFAGGSTLLLELV